MYHSFGTIHFNLEIYVLLRTSLTSTYGKVHFVIVVINDLCRVRVNKMLHAMLIQVMKMNECWKVNLL